MGRRIHHRFRYTLCTRGQTTKKTLSDRPRYTITGRNNKGKIPAMVYRGDTIRFNHKESTYWKEDDVARNILEQMPGVEVSEKSVKVAGKDVEKTYVDGKRFLEESNECIESPSCFNDVVYISAYDEDEHKEQTRKTER